MVFHGFWDNSNKSEFTLLILVCMKGAVAANWGGQQAKIPPWASQGGALPPLSIFDQNVHRLIEFSRVAQRYMQLITLSYSRVAK